MWCYIQVAGEVAKTVVAAKHEWTKGKDTFPDDNDLRGDGCHEIFIGHKHRNAI